MRIKLGLKTTWILKVMKLCQHCNIFKPQQGPCNFGLLICHCHRDFFYSSAKPTKTPNYTNIQQILLKIFSLQNLGQIKYNIFKSLGKLLEASVHQFVYFFGNRRVLICQSISFANNLVLFFVLLGHSR